MDTDQGWRMSHNLPMMKKKYKRTEKKTFMDYLRSQQEHITQYYDTQIIFNLAPITIYELLKSPNKLVIATDGGAIPFKGSTIGFVIANEEGTILATCYGQPSGNDYS